MSKIRTALSAAAMSMALAAPAYAQQANWTGLYLGINGGYGWGGSNQRSLPLPLEDATPAPTDGNYKLSGGLLGATLGVNWQVQNALMGLEADYAWSGISGSGVCGLGSQCGTDVKSFGTARGRLGLISGDNLFYLTGGLAFANVGAFDRFDPQEGTKTRTGWTVGGGLERKLQGSVSLKLEYLYADFGHVEHFQNTAHTPEKIGLDTHLFRVGLNIALDGGENSARPGLK